MSDWTAVRLDSIGRVVTGKTPSSKEPELFGTSIPFITPSEMEFGERSAPAVRYLSEEGAQRQRKLLLPEGSVGFVCIASIGKASYFTQPTFTNQQVNSIVVDQRFFSPLFIYYMLVAHRERIASRASGVATPIINKSAFSEIEFVVPSLDVQKRIAGVLSAYDDLIENNTRRIAILEEMARRLYEEWFVHFRFPGHETTAFINTPKGRLPEGWRQVGLYDVAEVTYGHPFKSKLFNSHGAGIGVIRIRDVTADMTSTYTTEYSRPQHMVRVGDILIGMDGTFYIGRWAGDEAWLNQRVARLRPKPPVGRHFLSLAITGPIKRLEETIVGTTVAHLSARDLKQMQLVIPTEALTQRGNAVLEPMFASIINLKRSAANVRIQRDLLLPKLVSGEIDLAAAEALALAAE